MAKIICFGRAKFAKESYQNAQENENFQITQYGNEINAYIDGNREYVSITKDDYDKFKSIFSVNGNKSIYSPNTWDVGTEYCWQDGENMIYGQRFTGTTASNTKVATISGISMILNHHIEVYKNGSQGPVSSGFWSTTNYVSGIYYANISDNSLYFAVSSNYTNITYEVWLIYTK